VRREGYAGPGGRFENAEDGFTPEEIATENYPAVTIAAARRIMAFARLPVTGGQH
jgi:hypothetical protein